MLSHDKLVLNSASFYMLLHLILSNPRYLIIYAGWFCQLGIVTQEGGIYWGTASVRQTMGKYVGHFLIVDWWRTYTVGCEIPRQVVLCYLWETSMGVNSIPLCSLLQFLPLGFCLALLPWLSLMMDCYLYPNKSFSPWERKQTRT